jgi:REP element-mobilizing transposase RayT
VKQPANYHADFTENGIYHVYSRTNNKELLFRSDENRLYFLRQYDKYLHPFLDTFCWNLLPNHFHLLVQIKPSEEIKKYLKSLSSELLKPIEKEYLAGKTTTEKLLELEWKRFFNSYSMAFNRQHQRSGNLFHRPFKRLEVEKESHFTQTVVYIHGNAQRHKLCKDFTQHKWSSWHTIISDSPTKLKRQELLDWFGGKGRFIKIHKELSNYYYDTDLEIE